MTTLQQAQELLTQLPDEKLADVIVILKKLVLNLKTDNLPAKQEAERQKRLAALEDIRKTREELIAMDIDWKSELVEALKEKYGA